MCSAQDAKYQALDKLHFKKVDSHVLLDKVEVEIDVLEKRLSNSLAYTRELERRIEGLEKEVEEGKIKLLSLREVPYTPPYHPPAPLKKPRVEFPIPQPLQRPTAPMPAHMKKAGQIRPPRPLGFLDSMGAKGPPQGPSLSANPGGKRKEGPSQNFRENSNFPFRKNGPPAEEMMRQWAEANGYSLVPVEGEEDPMVMELED